MKLLLEISYLGSNYCGFQVQKNAVTIQQKVQDAIEALYGTRYPIQGCSRTDAGVHARQYFCTAELGDDINRIPCDKLPYAVNCYMPCDISVISARMADNSFHVRHDVLFKEYEYIIYNSRINNPFYYGRTWRHFISNPDISNMAKAAKLIEGKHDFSSFMASGSDISDTVRTVKSCGVTADGDLIRILISADGFLYNMVRIIAGTLAAVAEKKLKPESITDIINSCNRENAGCTAPPEGLYLNRVVFTKEGMDKIL